LPSATGTLRRFHLLIYMNFTPENVTDAHTRTADKNILPGIARPAAINNVPKAVADGRLSAAPHMAA
jgi:hypothetical protein